MDWSWIHRLAAQSFAEAGDGVESALLPIRSFLNQIVRIAVGAKTSHDLLGEEVVQQGRLHRTVVHGTHLSLNSRPQIRPHIINQLHTPIIQSSNEKIQKKTKNKKQKNWSYLWIVHHRHQVGVLSAFGGG